jgi:hypothetical protein
MRDKLYTLFIDFDGTCCEHFETLPEIMKGGTNILDGVFDKFQEWRNKGYYVVITTARPESLRAFTTGQIHQMGIYYDQLVMGIPTGPRVVINDEKPDGTITAYAKCVRRNKGLRHLEVENL